MHSNIRCADHFDSVWDARASQFSQQLASTDGFASLVLIETPVSEAKQKQLADYAQHPFERLGLALVRRMQPKLDKLQLAANLARACAGKLRVHEPQTVARIQSIRRCALWKVLLIAFVTNLIPGLYENWHMWRLETDGLAPIYTACHNCSGGVFSCDPAPGFAEVVTCAEVRPVAAAVAR